MKFTTIYDSSISYFVDNEEYNLIFLRSREQYLNDLLRARGVLFLNQVLDCLGIPLIRFGQIYGWNAQDGTIKMDISKAVGTNGFIITFDAGNALKHLPYETKGVKIGRSQSGGNDEST